MFSNIKKFTFFAAMKTLKWILRILAAGILLQTLFFKFTGAEESIFIFTKLKVEPLGRWAAGIFELIAAVLLLIPKWTKVGAILGLGIMAGAIFAHLFILGVEIQGDGGLLFIYALAVALSCIGLIFISKREGIPFAKFI